MQSQIKNGIAYDFFEGTKRQDITLVWVHGTGANKKFMEAVRPTLSEFSNIFFDLPGHGDSKDTGFSENNFTNAILYVLSGRENVVLIGHSLGGALVLDVLKERPQNVIGGVILNGAARFNHIDPAFYQKIHEGVLDLPYVLAGCGHENHPKVKKAMAAMELDAIAIKDWLIDEKIDVRGALAKIDVPVEILVGEDDPFAPVSDAKMICDSVKDGHILTVAHGKHMSFLTDDAKLTACVDRVLIKAGKAQVDTSPILTALVDEVTEKLKNK